MPLLFGPITRSGAVVDALIGVFRARSGLLSRHGFPVPSPVRVRAMIDPGASMSGVAPDVFRQLELTPIAQVPILTPSTTAAFPHLADEYLVSFSVLVQGTPHTFSDALPVIVADGWNEGEDANALIGRDILERCLFSYCGPDARFYFAF